MQWKMDNIDDLVKFQYGKFRKVPKKNQSTIAWRERAIASPYVRLIQQLIIEHIHGQFDLGHESLRRKSYAARVLNSLGLELDSAPKVLGLGWRSKVLTPILQRQLFSVPDEYGPAMHAALSGYSKRVSKNEDEGESSDSDDDDSDSDSNDKAAAVTISDATAFYLGCDPLDPSYIPMYRRNILYSRAARWHLSVEMNNFQIEDKTHFNSTLVNQDYLLAHYKEPKSDGGIPPFTFPEVLVIYYEEIENFFAEELARVVSVAKLSATI